MNIKSRQKMGGKIDPLGIVHSIKKFSHAGKMIMEKPEYILEK